MAQAELTLAKLNQLFDEAESVDKELHAEMRSNVLLVAGEHFTKRDQMVRDRLRDAQQLTEAQKLRITKNHMHRVARKYETAIMRHAPGVAIKPQRDTELQDQKAAELNQAVHEYGKQTYRFKEKTRRFAKDFTRLGECCCVIKFDPNAGEVRGYNQAVHPETGEPQVDEQGQPAPDHENPVYMGEFVFERTFGFDLLRESGAKAPDDEKAWVIRKMVSLESGLALCGGDEDKEKAMRAAAGETYVVFDAQKKGYSKAKKEDVCIREYYWPKSSCYKQGWFCIATSAGIIEQGPLPGGIWPIVFGMMDEHQTSPRGRSILKIARPWQAEINRASSALALHQVTVGDDKVIYQTGTKLQPGALLPGVRGITYQGAAPQILPGRDGSQFLGYLQSQVVELDLALGMNEVLDDKSANLDPYSLLFASATQAEKFASYGDSFGQFLVDFTMTFLELAKFYLPDECVIEAIGKAEAINMQEFRDTKPQHYQITAEEQSETIETKLGRQLTYAHVLQYTSSSLGKDDIGRMIRAMPFANNDKAFNTLTLDDENVDSDMLALERGEYPAPNEYDNHDYYLKVLANRMKKRDFQFLAPQVQQNYKRKEQEHLQAKGEQEAKIAAAKSEYIPTGGAMITCDMYIPDPEDQSKAAKRVRIPYQALDWLVKILQNQGNSQAVLEQQNHQTLSELADMIGSQRGLPPSGQGMPPGGGQAPQQGAA